MNNIIWYLTWFAFICVGAFFIWHAFKVFITEGPTYLFAVDVMLAISSIVGLVKFIMR